VAAPTGLLKALHWEVTQKKNLAGRCGEGDLCFMSSSCDVPLGVSAVRVSRIGYPLIIEAVAVVPVKASQGWEMYRGRNWK
jgi:hypothetical protein